MKKSAMKKFLTVLIAIMLVVSMLSFVACNPENPSVPGDENENVDTEAPKPSFKNGNFATPSNPDAKEFPKSPSGWTGNGVTTSQSTPDGDKPALPETEKNTVNGIVSHDKETYNKYKNKWGDLPWFENAKTDIEGYTDDKNSLMIYNKEASYYYYDSDSFTIAKNTDYILTVTVKTVDIKGNTNIAEGFEERAGAYIYLYGSSATYSRFVKVDTKGEWQTYKFVIQGSPASSKSIYLRLGLGIGNSSTKYDDAYLASGHVFFDNVTYEAIDEDSKLTYENAEESDVLKKATTMVPNAEFDYTSGNNPSLYSKTGISNVTKYCQVNTEEPYFNAKKESYGNVENPGTPEGSVGSNVYMLYNKSESAIGMSTSNKLYFDRGRAYKLSIWVKTIDVTPNLGATLKLTMNKEDTVDDIVIENINTQGEWTEYSFFICSNQNIASEFHFQFWLGTGESADTDSHVKGWAFFDKLSIEEINLDNKTFEEAVNEIKNPQDADPVDLTTDRECNLLDNGYFDYGTEDIEHLEGWTVAHDDDNENEFNGVNFGSVSRKVVTANDEKIKLGDAEFENPNTPYKIISDKVLALYSSETCLYSMKYDLNTLTIKPYTAYRFSFWVKTKDVPETTGVYVKLKKGDKAIATFDKVNTEKAKDTINGYVELVCYIYGDENPNDITLETTLGTGNKWTSETLFKGSAYIANVSLVETTYSEFNSASTSGNYNKKYNFVTKVDTQVPNGGFNDYDHKKIDGLTTGGMVENEEGLQELSKNFGTPANWKINDISIAGTYYGIVDTLRNGTKNEKDNLLKNLADTQLVDINTLKNLFFTNPENDLELFKYCGENKALFVGSPDNAEIQKEFVSYGYETSSTLSLEANTYYEISVMVKTVGDSKASVYLIKDSENDADASFKNINTSEATLTNGWKRHTFRIKVGVNSVSAQLGLYLGANDNPADTEEGTTATGGAVFFDSVTKKEIEAEEFESEIKNSDIEEIKTVTFSVDSFGLDEDAEHDEDGSYITPSNWTGKNNAKGSNVASTNAGVLITDKYNFVDFENEEELRKNLTAHNGTNVLVINNKLPSAYTFTSTLTKLNKNSFYRISVWAKVYDLDPEKSAAYIKLNIPDKFNIENENIFRVVSGEYQRYDFYVATTEKTDLSKVTLELGLGELIGEDPYYVSGYALFDDVEWSSISEEEFKAAEAGDNVKIYTDAEDTPVNPDDPDEEKPEKKKNDFNWILFSSLAFAIVLIIVLVVYFVKKYRPKKKANKKAKVDTSKKDEKYKNLKD